MKKAVLILCLFCGFYRQTDAKTICLNMIVKNESQVIENCLGSLKDVIDYWVIVDTGSTDGTQQVIRNFMKEIPGELHERDWVDFAHNRNEALSLAKDKGDYLLFIDADEMLSHADSFTMPPLDKDYYLMNVRSVGGADAMRKSVVNNHLDWQWQGVVHEDIYCPQAKTADLLTGVVTLFNVTKGARAKDPLTPLKDALLLEKALEKEPSNSRYMFYLAWSYLNAEKYDKALAAYEKRVAMPSLDVQETYSAMYAIGLTKEKLNMPVESILESYSKAHVFRPTRAEPLFRMAVLYRKAGNPSLGYEISKLALSLPYPTSDPYVEYATYDHALLIEHANCALLSGRFQEGLEATIRLLSNPNLPLDIRGPVAANAEYARKQLAN
jgi:glycosyltransferase involved in cell wall biosynthesis